ncbi:5'-methylthioadenosine/S-adenosylhomocysteine nucleosidase [Planktothrix sp. FACHB-1355]|uniref:5'-methylthioadenosine/S-adenosylhomocysteine nucleosidase n=1 Tax=Aerosakkonema funiforme FACHB-1375 TaxID=2949571 RepID=A0A926ZF10_9CYAN|nr:MULTISPECIES: 5'-methylthioadenosine/S-adenosylhomocysteine nucleosidase [Oscillatoriales]MBD2180365.1 5'-methylthioadenosine/S-adenosylhomocysteine nucleosidase [Aerosakkonema funiforme FACHB-1375]MBD3557503.1 5'-methylthioadenosine/S-adenosylhomocysteine nucleosidase [Planktothrix sp. FACHB-1355]
MSGNFRQSIAQSGSIRQAGTLPTAIAQAEAPKQPVSAMYEGIEGGTATDWAVILTALGAEHKAVEAHLEPIGQATRLSEEIHPNGTIYTQGQFKAHNCTWNVAIAQIDMGNASAGIEAVRAMMQFNPRVILFVGVAGGIKDVKVGDVVAASIVYGYECGKPIDDRTLPRPKLGEADYDLKQRAQAEARKDDWRNQIRSGSSSDAAPTAHVKPIAAGEKVIASRKAKVYEYLREYYDDAIAVEMEGFGFLKATQQVKNVSAIVIRGISDLLDGKNDDSIEPEQVRQERAAHHASAFAFTLLAKLDGESVTERWEVYQTTAQVALDSTLPEGMISLNIQALLEENQCFIHAHHGKRTFTNRGQFDRSLIDLHQQIEGNLTADNLLSVIDDCNARVKNSVDCVAGQLLTWLHQQQNDSLDQVPCLIIDERTEFEIPWELLESGKKPVGVAFQTVRQRQMEPEAAPVSACCGGGVLVYAHEKYGGWQRYQRQQFTVFQEFLSQMQKPATEFGLVFIDGFSVEEPLKSSPTAYIKRSKLFKGGTSIVFISGQLHLDASISLTHRMLLTNFLEHGAKGIVGALKRIDRARAKEVVDLFSEEHRQHPEWTVPEILRRLRERVWEALEDEVNANTCASYLAAFLHVYYGNPMIRLQLTSAEGKSND